MALKAAIKCFLCRALHSLLNQQRVLASVLFLDVLSLGSSEQQACRNKDAMKSQGNMCLDQSPEKICT